MARCSGRRNVWAAVAAPTHTLPIVAYGVLRIRSQRWAEGGALEAAGGHWTEPGSARVTLGMNLCVQGSSIVEVLEAIKRSSHHPYTTLTWIGETVRETRPFESRPHTSE